MPASDSLGAAMVPLRPRLPRLLVAITLGAGALGSALALAALSAWLITRAWQMPPLAYLTVAVVAVRALAISRAVLRYCERLASHDTALRAAGAARERLYTRLARGPVDVVMRRRSGDLVSRLGADVEQLAEVLVRACVPVGVAAVMSVAAIVVTALFSPAAAAVMAICLAAAGVVAPWLTAHAVLAEETVAAQQRSARDAAAMTALEYGTELRVAGRLAHVIAESQRRQQDWAHAVDRAAAPAALASAVPAAAIGVSVIGAAAAGIGLANDLAPTTVAVLMLLPLAAFEATAALPAAAVALTRARVAARRVQELTTPRRYTPGRRPVPAPLCVGGTDGLVTIGVQSGYGPSKIAGPFTVSLAPGARAIVTGPSGSGKTALLMTLAGLLAPRGGLVSVNGRPVASIVEAELRCLVQFFAEDAHLFATTVRDNLLVARGNCRDDELLDALHRVGLMPWVDSLPDGLSTVLTGGAEAVSAGQRRRLLLARALISPARIVLLDEPTEHLDARDAEPILGALLDPDGPLFGRDRTVVVATHQRQTCHRQVQIAAVA